MKSPQNYMPHTNPHINPFFIVTAYLYQTITWPATRLFLYFFGHLKVSGLEQLQTLPKGQGVIFVSNHASELDAFITPASLPFMSRFIPLFYMIRERSFYDESGIRQLLYGGFLFKCIGGQHVYAGLQDYDKSMPNHIQLLKQNRNVFVFPEGSISRITGKIKEAKGGVAFLAEKTGATVVPVAISGLYKLRLMDLIMRKRYIHVQFGQPITQGEIKSAITRDPQDIIGVYKKEAEYIMSKIGAMVQY